MGRTRSRGRTGWRAALLTAAAVLLAGAAGGCAADPDGFNDADVDYASDMTQHHAQTVHLVNLALGRRLPSRTSSWTDAARGRRLAELEEFASLLRSWGHEVPVSGLRHSDEGEDISFDSRIPGVLGDRQMAALQQAQGPEFTRSWIRHLIRHERGAVQIAAEEVAEGQNARAVAKARKDEARHADLVAELQRLAGAADTAGLQTP